MSKQPKLILPTALAGVVFLVIAIVYFIEPASSLPSFFPGHEAASSHHHTKHGIAALVVAVGCFIFAWFQSGPSQASPA